MMKFILSEDLTLEEQALVEAEEGPITLSQEEEKALGNYFRSIGYDAIRIQDTLEDIRSKHNDREAQYWAKLASSDGFVDK